MKLCPEQGRFCMAEGLYAAEVALGQNAESSGRGSDFPSVELEEYGSTGHVMEEGMRLPNANGQETAFDSRARAGVQA